MGYGRWTRESFFSYSQTMGRKTDSRGELDRSLTDTQLFAARGLSPRLNPFGVVRECCDSAEHPDTLPVILALDVTGSMGRAAAEVARKLNTVMSRLYDTVRDVECLVMGIGDLAYDRVPVQMSQFESDIRIAEQLDQLYLEHGGGGNGYESYTAAWYMGLHHTRLDCWKRGRKGLIITMGDEALNPYLPRAPLAAVTGDSPEADVETAQLYREVLPYYDMRHLHVAHRNPDIYLESAKNSFSRVLGEENFLVTDVDGIAERIIGLVQSHRRETEGPREISWHTSWCV